MGLGVGNSQQCIGSRFCLSNSLVGIVDILYSNHLKCIGCSGSLLRVDRVNILGLRNNSQVDMNFGKHQFDHIGCIGCVLRMECSFLHAIHGCLDMLYRLHFDIQLGDN